MSRKYYNTIEPADYLLNKDLAMQSFIKYHLDRTQSMFSYSNLPKSMPESMIELMLQRNGNIFIAKENGELYAFSGGEGGEPDVYGRPTIYTVANPALNISKNYKIGVDGILVKNDTYEYGLLPMFNKYGTLIVENEITIRTIIIYLRIVGLISASDDNTKASADSYLEHIVAGNLAVVADSPFFDGVKIQSLGNSSAQYVQQFIELEQYLKGSMYNELGLNANYNMKREALTKGETSLNEDFLMPFCDDMLDSRKRGWDEVNEMFGTEISVEYSSTWKKRSITDILAIQQASVAHEELQSDSSQLDNEQTEELNEEVENIADETVTDNVDDGNDDAQSDSVVEDDDTDVEETVESIDGDELVDDNTDDSSTDDSTDESSQLETEQTEQSEETETETETEETETEETEIESEESDEEKKKKEGDK